ncbi:Fic family protein [Paraliobacillus ryukyuensis]|uniref:Fic family protein n=1 Tax=Paraliobacillus ryukyuensis TaxID=200904 RepID=UPI0009A5FD33|nr:Fic family protein [Paraliobacillus ryukyuensis]
MSAQIDFGKLTELKKNNNKRRPLSKQLVKSLQEDYLIKNTYHSNAIEGNTLTVYETKAILEEGVTISGKSMQEHLEAINHKQAILLSEEIVKKKEPITERSIKDLHGIILYGIDNSNAGVYRNDNAIISGASHTPPPFLSVPQEMSRLMDWYQQENTMHPVEKAAVLHSKFVNIHPFVDGNGRTARLLMNLELFKSGYLPIIIEKEHRSEYYRVLDIAEVSGNYDPFANFLANYEEQELTRYNQLLQRERSVNKLDL